MQLPPFHANRPHLVAPVRADPLGVAGPTRRQSRGSAWRTTSRGFHVPASVDGTAPQQRILEAAAPMPPAAGITGWASLNWQGAAWFDGRDRSGLRELNVTIASCQDDIRAQHGFVVCQERLNPAEVIEVDGLRVTHPARSVCFEMRYAGDLRQAVVVLDMSAYSDLVSIAEVTEYALAHPGWTGIPQARDALALADENSWSPWETEMRLVWVVDAGLPRPLCNRPVFDLGGRLLGTPDILDPEAGVAGEYEGSLHLQGRQRAHDVGREQVFRNHGLEYFVVLSEDMRDHAKVADRMAATRVRALRSDLPRQWTLTPPPWWSQSHTVEQRRALTGRARDAVLRLRRRTA